MKRHTYEHVARDRLQSLSHLKDEKDKYQHALQEELRYGHSQSQADALRHTLNHLDTLIRWNTTYRRDMRADLNRRLKAIRNGAPADLGDEQRIGELTINLAILK